MLIPIAVANITRAIIAFTTAGLPGGVAGERQAAASSAMKDTKMGKAKALNGTVPGYPQDLAAAAAAQRVGVS